mmetsp:Transcript_35157/g.117486  ORF Transcript_35157/g.117486 Transcript_35157/m.117486 type:complete len:231 (-) Transcript_35157:426-1118(-)
MLDTTHTFGPPEHLLLAEVATVIPAAATVMAAAAIAAAVVVAPAATHWLRRCTLCVRFGPHLRRRRPRHRSAPGREPLCLPPVRHSARSRRACRTWRRCSAALGLADQFLPLRKSGLYTQCFRPAPRCSPLGKQPSTCATAMRKPHFFFFRRARSGTALPKSLRRLRAATEAVERRTMSAQGRGVGRQRGEQRHVCSTCRPQDDCHLGAAAQSAAARSRLHGGGPPRSSS